MGPVRVKPDKFGPASDAPPAIFKVPGPAMAATAPSVEPLLKEREPVPISN
jgi:hypothetical protein